MNPKQTPHPLVEDHHHIQGLIAGQARRTEDRERYRNVKKDAAEREDDIARAKRFDSLDFWCGKCKEDFRAVAELQVERDWSLDRRNAFYRAKCGKGHWCGRLVTDRHMDGFFISSRLVNLDRGNHFADILQPFETGFNMVYGKQ